MENGINLWVLFAVLIAINIGVIWLHWYLDRQLMRRQPADEKQLYKSDHRKNERFIFIPLGAIIDYSYYRIEGCHFSRVGTALSAPSG